MIRFVILGGIDYYFLLIKSEIARKCYFLFGNCDSANFALPFLGEYRKSRIASLSRIGTSTGYFVCVEKQEHVGA